MIWIAQREQGTLRAARPDSEAKCEGNMQAAPVVVLSAFFLAMASSLRNPAPGTWLSGSPWHQVTFVALQRCEWFKPQTHSRQRLLAGTAPEAKAEAQVSWDQSIPSLGYGRETSRD